MIGNFISKNIIVYKGDIPEDFFEWVSQVKIVGWDIETSGLDWRKEKIGTCQLYAPNKPPAIVKIGKTVPKNLCELLADESVKKIFHYALFDLSFMASHWQADPKNIACTKVAIKLLDPKHAKKHSLASLLKEKMGVIIDKNEQCSNWLSPKLTDKQKEYAVKDAVYLPELLKKLEADLKSQDLLDLARQCWDHIPTEVQLEIKGIKDVFGY
jgi:ribonuclease D